MFKLEWHEYCAVLIQFFAKVKTTFLFYTFKYQQFFFSQKTLTLITKVGN